MSHLRLGRTFVLLVALLTASPALADPRGTYLLGEHLAGMGGAGVALSDEPTGGVRNPAGLALISGTRGSLAMSAYELLLQRQEGFLKVGDTSVDLSLSRFTTFPACLGVAVPMGGDEHGVGRHVLAINILVPDRRDAGGRVESDLSAATPDAPAASFDFELDAQQFQFGVAWGFWPARAVRVGAMMSYVLDLRTFTTLSSVEQPDGAFTFGSQSFRGAAGSLLFDAGVQIDVHPQWTVGLAVRSETVRLHGSGEGTIVVASSRAADRERAVQATGVFESLELSEREPWRFALGVAYHDPEQWRVALDLYLHLAQSPFLDIRDPAFPEFDIHGAVSPDQLFGQNAERNTVVNGALGGQFPVAEWLTLRAGLLTSLSPYPDPDVRDPKHPSRNHAIGATFGLTYPSEHTTMSLVLSYLFGFGEGLAPRTELDGTATFERVAITQHRLVALFGGSVSF